MKEFDINTRKNREIPIQWGTRITASTTARPHYSSFIRDSDVFSIGSCISLLNPEGALFIARIIALWEEKHTHEKMVQCQWYWTPEETVMGRQTYMGKDEIFETAHVDNNTLDTISDLVDILDEEAYKIRMAQIEKEKKNTEKRRRIYYCKLRYDHDEGKCRPLLKGTTRSITSLPARSLPSISSSIPSSNPHASIYSQACHSLQLSTTPKSLPCRTEERTKIFNFLQAAIQRKGSAGGLCMEKQKQM
jgi:hypothetical protein